MTCRWTCGCSTPSGCVPSGSGGELWPTIFSNGLSRTASRSGMWSTRCICSVRSRAATSATSSARAWRRPAGTTRLSRGSSTWSSATTSVFSISCGSTIVSCRSRNTGKESSVKNLHTWAAGALAFCLIGGPASGLVRAQAQPTAPVQPPATPPSAPVQQPAPAPVTQETPLPSGYVIGPDDVLVVSYWRNPEMSAEVTVRPDGLISLPLLNELQAGGLTPEQLRDKISKAAMKYLEEPPTLAIVVKAINSRKVYVTGMVAKPGYYQLTGAMTVVQLLATAGGIQEFADSKNITIVRNEGGKQTSYPFN